MRRIDAGNSISLFLTKQIVRIAEQKGHKSRKYIISTIFLWFAGEMIGGIFGAGMVSVGGFAQVAAYFMALLGAFMGAFIAYQNVQGLETVSKPPGAETASPGNSSPIDEVKSQPVEQKYIEEVELLLLKKDLNEGNATLDEYERKAERPKDVAP